MFGGGWLQLTPAHGSPQLPAPSQVPPGQTVPTGANVVAQVPATHVRWLHAVSVPGQSLDVTQLTHCPAPSHVPPGHVVPAADGMQAGMPPVHVAVVQVPQAGRLVLSGPNPQTPAVQTACWHVPGTACGQSDADVQPVPPPPHPLAQTCSSRATRASSSAHEQASRQTPFVHTWPP